MATKVEVLRALCTLDGEQLAEGDVVEMDEKNLKFFGKLKPPAVGLYLGDDDAPEVKPEPEEKPKPRSRKKPPAAPAALDNNKTITPDPRAR